MSSNSSYTHEDISRQDPPFPQKRTPEEEEREEREHFQKIVDAFAYYAPFSMRALSAHKRNFMTLSERHAMLLPKAQGKWEKWQRCIYDNDHFISCLLANMQFYPDISIGGINGVRRASSDNMEKVLSTMRQFVRDWSETGRSERESCYTPILDEIKRVVPINSSVIANVVNGNGVDAPRNVSKDNSSRRHSRILCPGSGLMRLPFEICRLGYNCQGNEWSYFMLIGGSYILNHCSGVNVHSIFPFIHQTSNTIKVEDMFQEVKIPDICPSTTLNGSVEFSCVAGGFVDVYREQKESWDCVVTCFFLDTANNVLEYVEVIHDILVDGGVWINFGPLLYHYSDLPYEQSIEITLEELFDVVKQIGFNIERESLNKTFYTNNTKSLMQTEYTASFFTARKIANKTPNLE